MNLSHLCLTLGVAACAGCATLPLPPKAAVITLERVSSTAVAVYQPKLVVQEGELLLDGWVYRQYGAQTTAQTHIDVAFLDVNGRELHRELTYFRPHDLRTGTHRMAHRGHYTLPIPAMPAETAKIQVRAHDALAHQP